MAYNENNFDVDGVIIHIGMPVSKPTKRGGDFTFRIIVLELQAGQYVTEAKFMFINKHIDLLNQGFAVKDRVHINFQITGRRFLRKEGHIPDWYVSLEARNISKL